MAAATKMDAIRELGPHVVSAGSVSEEEYIDYMVRNSGMSDAAVKQFRVLDRQARMHFLGYGRFVPEPGWGLYFVSIDHDGQGHVNFRADANMVDKLFHPFNGVIANAENIGKSVEELVAIWNADPAHADRQIPTA